MLPVPQAFLLVGVIIGIGFVGSLFFERTRIPDLLSLVVIGILMGPVFGLVDASQLDTMAPYVGALALMIILFEGGLNLDFEKIVTQLVPAFLLTVSVFAFSMISLRKGENSAKINTTAPAKGQSS